MSWFWVVVMCCALLEDEGTAARAEAGWECVVGDRVVLSWMWGSFMSCAVRVGKGTGVVRSDGGRADCLVACVAGARMWGFLV